MSNRIVAPIYKNDGASFYRLELPIRYLLSDGLAVNTYPFFLNKFKGVPLKSGQVIIDRMLGASWDYLKLAERYSFLLRLNRNDVVWVNRSLLSFPNRIDNALKNVVYDFDDAIWLNGEANHCFESYCRRAAVVFAGNEYLANYACRFSRKVEIIPTSVDLNLYRKTDRVSQKFNVGWIGSSTGFGYLKDIEQELRFFFEKHRDARLAIVSEAYPKELNLLTEYIDFKLWSRESENAVINDFSVGLMPLRNTEWERGKCSFKMLQYMACEVPVIVSAIGMNVEVIDHKKVYGNFGVALTEKDDWLDVLDHYYRMSTDTIRKEGSAGREVISNHFSTEKISKEILSHFRNRLLL